MKRLLCLLAAAVASCSEGAPDPAGPSRRGGTPAAAVDKIQFKLPDGTLLCKLKTKPDGYRIYDPTDAVLGEVKVESDRVKLKDHGDVVVWKIKKKDYGAEIENDGGTRLYRIRLKSGDWQLMDAKETVLARAKPKPDGFELRDPEGKTIAKAKKRAGKVVLETESGERLHDVTGTEVALGAVWFAYDKFSLPERSAICAFFVKVFGS